MCGDETQRPRGITVPDALRPASLQGRLRLSEAAWISSDDRRLTCEPTLLFFSSCGRRKRSAGAFVGGETHIATVAKRVQ